MKNIHVLPTDKPSRLFEDDLQLYYSKDKNRIGSIISNKHIYITSDEEIKEGDWYFNNTGSAIEKLNNRLPSGGYFCKKIILTTDQDLIKDGVQPIPDEFLEWFVKNPSCDEIEFEKFHGINTSIAEVNTISGDGSLNWEGKSDLRDYKIIIPKEEPKQETLEEIVNKLSIKEAKDLDLFLKGIEWQKEQNKNKYSDGEVLPLLEILEKCKEYFLLKTDAKSEERADAICQAIEDFNKIKNK
jgi:uncharacterized protein YheU (UPF0270 family)